MADIPEDVMDKVTLRRPDDFRMGFLSKADSGGTASIYVAEFRREHIAFLLKAIDMADKILAIDDREEAARKQPEEA